MKLQKAYGQMGGIYVHVPFCVQKCAYCNFYSVSDKTLADAYVTAVQKEAALKAAEAGLGFTADTLYFGGGTPSTLSPQQVQSIINALARHFTLNANSEITLEVNPATTDLAALKAYRDIGVNRLSIGMQSFNDDMLNILGRAHTAADSIAVFADARKAGFNNISLDIIYGLPGQTEALLRHDINRALALGPEHISAYMLTVEPETVLGQKLAAGIIPPVCEDFQRKAFDLVAQSFAKGGYAQYEISNFSRTGNTALDLRSRHNLKYWNFAPYIGLGPAAHSFFAPNRRVWNLSDVTVYIERLANNVSACEEAETLDAEQMQMEMIYLGLRQNRGIDMALFNALNRGVFTELCHEPLQRLTADGLLAVQNGFCALTAQGRPFLDYVTRTLVNSL